MPKPALSVSDANAHASILATSLLNLCMHHDAGVVAAGAMRLAVVACRKAGVDLDKCLELARVHWTATSNITVPASQVQG